MWMWVRLPLRVDQARHQPSDSPTLLTPLSPPFGYHCLHETTHRQPDNTPTSDAATSGPRTTLRETGLENLHQDSWAPPDVSRKKRLLRTPQTPHISGRSTALRSRERVAVCSRGDRRRVPHGLDLALGPDPVSGPQSGHAGGPIAHRWPVCTPGSPSCSRLRYQIPATRTHRSWTVTAWGAMRR